jgi:drug/metabolite transporter (DMT)-like permease
MARFLDHIYIFATIVLTVYSQLIFKWRIPKFGSLPIDFPAKLKFFLILLCDPLIFSAFIASFFSLLTWWATLTKFELSYAFPLLGCNTVLVLVLSFLLLGESMSLYKTLGVGLIVIGMGFVAQA